MTASNSRGKLRTICLLLATILALPLLAAAPAAHAASAPDTSAKIVNYRDHGLCWYGHAGKQAFVSGLTCSDVHITYTSSGNWRLSNGAGNCFYENGSHAVYIGQFKCASSGQNYAIWIPNQACLSGGSCYTLENYQYHNFIKIDGLEPGRLLWAGTTGYQLWDLQYN